MLSTEISTILLVNDDPMFEKVMVKVATKLNIALAVCHGLDDLDSLEGLTFDAAVVDCDMGITEGSDAVDDIERHLGNVPIILVSGTAQAASFLSGWRPSIKGFMPKAAGYRAILEAALSAHHMALDAA
jgi:CheY-like chemotaxis protein